MHCSLTKSTGSWTRSVCWLTDECGQPHIVGIRTTQMIHKQLSLKIMYKLCNWTKSFLFFLKKKRLCLITKATRPSRTRNKLAPPYTILIGGTVYEVPFPNMDTIVLSGVIGCIIGMSTLLAAMVSTVLLRIRLGRKSPQESFRAPEKWDCECDQCKKSQRDKEKHV
jgi:hypothetical protein